MADFQALPGSGLTATLDGKALCGGNDTFIGTTAPVSPEMKAQAAALAEAGVPTVAVALRGPYDLAGLPESVWTLAAFEYTEQSIRAVARVLRGEAEPTGRLPVTL